MTRVAYLAHPVGHDEDRVRNLENVNKWFLWLLRNTDFALNVPWKIYVDNLTEDPENRARGVRDDLTILGRCDLIILTGGKISPGMKTELHTAHMRGMAVIDLTSVGYEPSDSALSLLPDPASMLQ
jgi:hypothetical protein